MEPNELVTVYTVNDPTEAELLKAELHGEGIACEIGGKHQGGFTGVLKISLQTRARDADRARRFIMQRMAVDVQVVALGKVVGTFA